MKLTLIINRDRSCVAFIAGFLLAAWVRQPDLEKERVELALCRDREAKLQQLVDSLKAALRDTARGRDAEDCVKLPANFKDLIDQQEALEVKRTKVLLQLECFECQRGNRSELAAAAADDPGIAGDDCEGLCSRSAQR